MWTFIQGIIIINIICVCITDMTDASSIIKKILVYICSKGKLWTDKYECKLLTCSLCLTFHLSNIWLIIYILFVGPFNIWMLAIPIISALLTNLTYSLILLMKDIISTLINIVNKLIKLINRI